MKQFVAFYLLVLGLISSALIMAQEPGGWRAFYITIDLVQSSSEAHVMIDNTFAVLWNKFSHFQFTEPWVIVVQNNAQRQSTAYYYMSTLYVSAFNLDTSSNRLTIYIVEKAFLTSNALQLSTTYWGTDPSSFPNPSSFTLIGFGETFYTQLQAVYSSPPHGIMFVKEYGEGVEVLKQLPLYTSDGREYVVNAYTTQNETMPLLVNVTIYYRPGPIGNENLPSGDEPASGGSGFDYIIDLTLSPPYFTDFSNTTLCIIDDVGRYLYYYTYSESVSQRFKKIYVRIPADDYPFTRLKIYRCNEDWDEQGQMTGIYLLPGEYSVSMSLAYPRSIYVYNFRYYDPYGSGGGLIPTDITVWFTDGSNQTVAFTGHGWYNFTKDIVRYRMTLQRQAPLSASLYLEPNDVLAPHLWDWYFDGVDDYISVPTFSRPESFTILSSIYLINTEHENPIITMPPAEFSACYWRRIRLMALTDEKGWTAVYSPILTWYNYTWYFVGVSYDSASKNVTLYRNSEIYGPYVFYTISNVTSRVDVGKRGGVYFNGSISYVIIYSRTLSGVEIQTIYNVRVVNASNLEFFIDPTFMLDNIYYFNLGRYNATARAYNGVVRVLANETWIWHVKNSTSDGLLHIKFVPRGWFIEFRSPVDGRLLLTIDTSAYPSNQAGLVEDIAVQLGAPGNYVVTLRPSYPWGSPTTTATPILTTTTTATEPPTETTTTQPTTTTTTQPTTTTTQPTTTTTQPTTTTTATTTPGFSCEYCDLCWDSQNPPDWCEYCYLFCGPPSPTYTYTYTSQPGSWGQATTTSPVQPPSSSQASALIGIGTLLGLAGFSFAVIGPTALGVFPAIVYVLVMADILPDAVAMAIIAGLVALALYMFMGRRGER